MEREDQLRVAERVEVCADVAFICDESGCVLDASATVEDLLRRSAESVRGEPFLRLVSPRDEQAVRRSLSEARDGRGSEFPVTFRSGNGEPVEAKVSAWSFEVSGRRLTVCLMAAGGAARREAEERARRLADTQKVIATILEISLQDVPLEELLQRTLDLVLWIPWLSIEKKGAIFLAEGAPDALVMKVHRGLSTVLLSTCARVSFGSCLCGRAASARTPVYAADIDECHTTRYAGMPAHGHYCVPICSGDATLGVITTYLAPGHEASAIDLEFLLAVADTLAGVLIRHRAAVECRGLERRLTEMLRPDRLAGIAAAPANDLRELLDVFLSSAQELLRRLPAQDGLRGTAETIEHAAHRGLALMSRVEVAEPEKSNAPEVVEAAGSSPRE